MLEIKLCSIEFQNPILTASGTFGYGEEFSDLINLNKLGGMVLKGLTFFPKKGNMTPRIAETPCGMLNSVGLQNVGVEKFVKEKLPLLRNIKTPIIANIAGESIDENIKIVECLNNEKKITMYELNVSCPNVKQGGMVFGTDKRLLKKLIKKVKKHCKKPLIVKLSPNVTDIKEMAKISEGEGADAISAINTVLGMAIDIKKRRPVLKNIFGGLSGPAIKPIGLRAVWQIYNTVKIPIIGIGGIVSYKDVLEYIMAGASLVQIGTGNFIDTQITMKIIHDLKKYLKEKKIKEISYLIGIAH